MTLAADTFAGIFATQFNAFLGEASDATTRKAVCDALGKATSECLKLVEVQPGIAPTGLSAPSGGGAVVGVGKLA